MTQPQYINSQPAPNLMNQNQFNQPFTSYNNQNQLNQPFTSYNNLLTHISTNVDNQMSSTTNVSPLYYQNSGLSSNNVIIEQNIINSNKIKVSPLCNPTNNNNVSTSDYQKLNKDSKLSLFKSGGSKLINNIIPKFQTSSQSNNNEIYNELNGNKGGIQYCDAAPIQDLPNKK